MELTTSFILSYWEISVPNHFFIRRNKNSTNWKSINRISSKKTLEFCQHDSNTAFGQLLENFFESFPLIRQTFRPNSKNCVILSHVYRLRYFSSDCFLTRKKKRKCCWNLPTEPLSVSWDQCQSPDRLLFQKLTLKWSTMSINSLRLIRRAPLDQSRAGLLFVSAPIRRPFQSFFVFHIWDWK